MVCGIPRQRPQQSNHLKLEIRSLHDARSTLPCFFPPLHSIPSQACNACSLETVSPERILTLSALIFPNALFRRCLDTPSLGYFGVSPVTDEHTTAGQGRNTVGGPLLPSSSQFSAVFSAFRENAAYGQDPNAPTSLSRFHSETLSDQHGPSGPTLSTGQPRRPSCRLINGPNQTSPAYSYYPNGTHPVSSDKLNAMYPRDLQPMEASVAGAAVVPELADSPPTNDLLEAWLFDPFPRFVDDLPGPPASNIELGCDGTPEGCGILARALAILAGLGLASSAWRLLIYCEVDQNPSIPLWIAVRASAAERDT